jgi:pimeloyl-ACP methyl ester carboxylesterase
LDSGAARPVAKVREKSVAEVQIGKPAEESIGDLTITVDGHRVRYLHAGAGPPVVLIHGLLGYSFSWRFTIPALARHFSVYAPDLLGIGYSERVCGLDCSLRAQARRVLDFMRELKLDNADVVGTSHGGGLATLMAAMAAEQETPSLRRLVLVAPVNPWSAAGRRRIRVLASPVGGLFFRLLFPHLDATHDWFLRRLYADPSRIRPGTKEGYAGPLLLDGTFDYLLAILRCWSSDLQQIRAAYASIKVPTLLIWGDRDVAVLPQSAVRVLQAIPGSQLMMMPGIGHLPYEEAPEAFNQILLDFLLRR